LLYLYLDESGDLGFDFVNKRPSKFFTITIVALYGDMNNKKLSKIVKKVKRRKLGNKIYELKGSKTDIKVKKYFISKIRDIEFEIYSYTLNKIRVYKELTNKKDRIYNFIARLVLDKIKFKDNLSRINLIIDRSKNKKEIEEFNKYIVMHLKSKINPDIPLDINHQLSVETPGLQVADMFSWGIFRKYERKDNCWYNEFKDRVKFDDIYLP
jgi:hypothetical protein